MPYREKPTTRRTRILIVSVMWLFVGIPLMIGFWTWFGGWSLLLLAAAVWLTVDYVKQGDIFGTVDGAVRTQVDVFKDPHDRGGS